jgi:hypothetical protein
VIVINGQVEGTWKRTLQKNSVVVELNPFRSFSKPEKRALDQVIDQFGKFLGMAVILK